MGDFAAYLLKADHLLIMVAVWVGIATVQRLCPSLADNPNWVRALPAIPILACSVLVWVPGLGVVGTVSERVLLGLVLGAFSGQAHKLLKQSVFGNDKRIRDHPKRL